MSSSKKKQNRLILQNCKTPYCSRLKLKGTPLHIHSISISIAIRYVGRSKTKIERAVVQEIFQLIRETFSFMSHCEHRGRPRGDFSNNIADTSVDRMHDKARVYRPSMQRRRPEKRLNGTTKDLDKNVSSS